MNNPKWFWKSLNNLLNKSNKNTTTQIRVNNIIIHDPSIVLNVFNQHFSSLSSSVVFDPPTACDSSVSFTCRSFFHFVKYYLSKFIM